MIDNEILLDGLMTMIVKAHHKGHFICEKGFYPELSAAVASRLPVRDIEREQEEYKEFGYIPDRGGEPKPLPETYEEFEVRPIADALLLFGTRVEFIDALDGLESTLYRIVLWSENAVWGISGITGEIGTIHAAIRYHNYGPTRTQRFEHMSTVCEEREVEKCYALWQRIGWEAFAVVVGVNGSNSLREIHWKRPYGGSHEH